MGSSVSIDKEETLKLKMDSLGIKETDIEEKFIHSSKKGGQKVNKTSSTVRLYHAPSGMTVKCGESRSREMNRWFARRDLAEKILEKVNAALSARRQETERIRRQKRRRSRRQKAKILDDKRKHGDKKAARGRVCGTEEG